MSIPHLRCTFRTAEQRRADTSACLHDNIEGHILRRDKVGLSYDECTNLIVDAAETAKTSKCAGEGGGRKMGRWCSVFFSCGRLREAG